MGDGDGVGGGQTHGEEPVKWASAGAKREVRVRDGVQWCSTWEALDSISMCFSRHYGQIPTEKSLKGGGVYFGSQFEEVQPVTPGRQDD